MSKTPLDHSELCATLAQYARDFHHRGWMPGTAGNLSARDEYQPASFWISASGLAKGQLHGDDFLQINIDACDVIKRFKETARPSAETRLHRVIYQHFPQARACLHVHSVDACIAGDKVAAGQDHLPLPPLEVIKGLGIWVQAPKVSLPLFENLLDVAEIAKQIDQRFKHKAPPVDALMIRDHGVTVWGESLQQAYNRLEIVEFLMSYLARR